VGEEWERERGGSAEVYIVFGKIHRARRAQPAVSRARCEEGAAAQLRPQPVSCALRHSGLVFGIFLYPFFSFGLYLLYYWMAILVALTPQGSRGVERPGYSRRYVFIIIPVVFPYPE
jgi:hypothetical protein